MKPQEVKRALIKERLAAMTAHGKWQDRWLDHPFPAMGEPEKAVACLTDAGDYDAGHKAWLWNKASLHGVDSFFNQVRRRLSLTSGRPHNALFLPSWAKQFARGSVAHSFVQQSGW
jgi:hypothetical protein